MSVALISACPRGPKQSNHAPADCGNDGPCSRRAFRIRAAPSPGDCDCPRPQPHTPRHFRSTALLDGFWYPGYASNAVQSAPEVIVVQVPAPPAPALREEPKPITPLMIEWQDGRYVRVDSKRSAGTQAVTNADPPIHTKERTANPSSPEIAPALLIFRDGHSERVREYTITDGAIYARGDYWTDGFWNKKILLSALDISATLSANRGTGANFELPSAPNVVVVRP
jgi:hypothetical protein